MTEVGERSMVGLAEQLGIVDGLLFRRVSPRSWAHLGGFGRGRGWAGIVNVDDAEEPTLSAVQAGTNFFQRFEFAESSRVVGPYYARSGALVQVGNDVMVVLGNPKVPVPKSATDTKLRELAVLVDQGAEEVSPSKRLGDELEILHAVRAVISTPSDTLASTMTHIVRVALESLSCDLGILRDGHGTMTVVSELGDIEADTPGLEDAVRQLEGRAAGGTLCLQEVGSDSSLVLPRLVPSIRSILCLPISAPFRGTLVVAHTSAGPRGFTNLCQRLGEQLVDTANVIGHTAALRDDLRLLADEHRRAARTDPLTGLGNRLLWEEAVAAAQDELDDGKGVSIIAIDVDGLKSVNDNFGHDAGDDLLRRCGEVLRAHCRDGDVAARLGGDEFALLLPLDEAQVQRRLEQLNACLGDEGSDRDRIAASLGVATAYPGQRLSEAVRAADAAMYKVKRARLFRSTS